MSHGNMGRSGPRRARARDPRYPVTASVSKENHEWLGEQAAARGVSVSAIIDDLVTAARSQDHGEPIVVDFSRAGGFGDADEEV